MHDSIIEANGMGTYFGYEAYPQDLAALATAVAEYIWPQLEDPTIENIQNVILDSSVVSDLPNKPTVTIPVGVLDVFDQLVDDHTIELLITINMLELANVPTNDAALVDAYYQGLAGKSAIGFYYLSISVEKWLDEVLESQLTSTLKPITIVITLPEALRGMTSFKIVRVHGGSVSVLPVTYDAQAHTLTFTTDKFSTYAIQYADPNALPETGEKADLGWLFAIGGLLLLWLTKRPQVE